MILHLVRHGESLFNQERRIQGQSDVELSPLGHRQSAAVAATFKGISIDAIYASPLRRAVETAQPIAAELGLEIRLDDRLKEINAGMFQGLLWNEIEHLHPAEAARWKAQEPDFVIPGGESRRNLMARGRDCFSLLSIPAELNPFAFYNASISRLAWDKQVKVLSINELDHLKAIEVISEASAGDL
jgi:broad specificity phosphatase PhoE